VTEKQQFRYAVSTEMCQLKALALAKEQGKIVSRQAAGRGWIMRLFLQETNSVYQENLVFPSSFQMHMKRKYYVSRSILSVYGGSIPTFFHKLVMLTKLWCILKSPQHNGAQER
jgi:hypothetical protein